MVRLIRTPRVIRTYAQRLEVIKLTEELKNLQPDPAVFKEDFVHLVNFIIKLHEKVQELIWAGELKMSLNWMKLKVLRYSSYPTRRHWNGVKHILRYLRGTIDMGLYYPNVPKAKLIGYADAGHMSDPHNARSQTGYLFTCGDTVISWRSTKQSITATFSNHAEILAIHEASWECFWLRYVIHHIRGSCGLSFSKEVSTTLYEDNVACIVQLKNGYIKGDRTKHISPKFFFTHDLQKKGDINVQSIRSTNNLADLFTKAPPTATFERLVHSIGMGKLRDLK